MSMTLLVVCCCEMSTIPNTHTSEMLPLFCAEHTVKHHVNVLHIHNKPVVVTKKGFIDLYNYPRTPSPPRMIWFWRSFIVHTYFSEPLDCTSIADILMDSGSWGVPVTGYWVVHFWKDILNLGKNPPSFLPYFCIEDISSSSYQWRILAFLPSIYHI